LTRIATAFKTPNVIEIFLSCGTTGANISVMDRQFFPGLNIFEGIEGFKPFFFVPPPLAIGNATVVETREGKKKS